MFDKYKDCKNIKMPEDIKSGILNNVKEEINMRKYKPKLAVTRRILIYAAVFGGGGV
jgi:uncharacterized protein involved in tellurium resistance